MRNNTKAIELPIGTNSGVIDLKLGRIHVGTPVGEVVREIWRTIPRASRATIPKPLRRGVIAYIIDGHRKNLAVYRQVMGGVRWLADPREV